MNRLNSTLLAFATSGAFLVGCSSTTPPSCGGDDAKKTVLEISEDEIRTQLVPKAFGPTQPAYKDLVALAKEQPSLQPYVDVVDEQMKKVKLSLINIRTDSVDKDVNKTTCGADLDFGNGATPFPITYTVQPTENGSLYVTVFGL